MKMIEVKTAELVGSALDWAVAYHLNGERAFFEAFGARMLGRSIKEELIAGNIRPSTDWAQGGPLIEKYIHMIENQASPKEPDDIAVCLCWCEKAQREGEGWGPTKLVAACRAIVEAKLGDTVSVPAELL